MRTPSLRRHRPSGQAVVTLSGRDHYLGPWPADRKKAPPAAQAEYDRLISEWLANGRRPVAASPAQAGPAVGELIVALWPRVEAHYCRADGTSTGEIDNIRHALRPLRELYADLPAADLSPLKLKAVRQRMTDSGLCRGVVNSRVRRVVRMVKWGVAEEMMPVEVYQALKAVPGLQKGRCDAREAEPVLPVDDAAVEAALPFLLPPVAALVRFQRLTGCRPGEACALRPCDLDMTGPVWLYRPAQHKTQHRGKARAIAVGPKAQEVLRPFLRHRCPACGSEGLPAEIGWRAATCGPCKVAPCRVIEDVRSTDDEFVVLLRENNRQRVKTFAEMVREQVIDANPEEAHRRLVAHRRRMSDVFSLDEIEIVGEKHRAAISKAKEPILAAIQAILTRRRRFWPLTDRVVHYALLDNPPLRHASKPGSRYRNDKDSYKDVCDMRTRARIAGVVPWEAVDDPTGPVTVWKVHREPSAFIRGELGGFLKGFARDLMQSQPNHVEIVIEKNTLSGVIRPVAAEYTIPLTSGRGYSSSPPRHAMARRYRRSGKERLVILMLGDFDPEGQDIPHSFARSMRDDFGIDDIIPIKVGLNADQVEELQLPPIMKAKAGSSRRAGFVEAHGDDVFELEAVPPERLQVILREAIDAVIDIDAFNNEIDREKEDAVRLDRVRQTVYQMLQDANLDDATNDIDDDDEENDD